MQNEEHHKLAGVSVVLTPTLRFQAMTKITAMLVCMRLPFFGFLCFGPRLKKDLLTEVFYFSKRKYEIISLAFVIHAYFRFLFSFIRK